MEVRIIKPKLFECLIIQSFTRLFPKTKFMFHIISTTIIKSEFVQEYHLYFLTFYVRNSDFQRYKYCNKSKIIYANSCAHILCEIIIYISFQNVHFLYYYKPHM